MIKIILLLSIILVCCCLLSFKEGFWSRGLFDNEYNQSETEYHSNKDTIINEIKNCKDKIWIRNHSCKYPEIGDLDIFADNLHLLKKPVILVTGDGDRDVPSSYNPKIVNKILNSDKIIKWYTQNYDKTLIHSKLKYYPIFLDLHTHNWLKQYSDNKNVSGKNLRDLKLNYMKSQNLKNKNNKINKIFCDTHLSHTHPERGIMYDKIKNNKNIDFLESRINNKEIMNKYSQYRFVISPRGNGLDCHRTWEALLCGAIVIVKTSPLDDMYKNNNLPVIILNDWEDLNNNLDYKLNKWYIEHKDKLGMDNILEKFNPDYWISK